jgi:serine/threonine protein kinase
MALENNHSLADMIAETGVLDASRAAEGIIRLIGEISRLHNEGQIHRRILAEEIVVAGEFQLTLGAVEPVVTLGGPGCDPNSVPPAIERTAITVPAEIEAAKKTLLDAGILLDPRQIDFYQLGTLFCRMLTGKGVTAYLRSCQVKSAIPEPMQKIIDRALGMNSNDCFSSAEEFLTAIQEVADLPIKNLPFTHLAHYEIVDRIGHGGMGDVYKGYEKSLERFVAIKVLPAELSRQEDFVKRFHAEAAAIARIDHPNVVRIFYNGEDQSYHFFAMQFVEGQTLAELIKRQGRLDADRAIPIAEQCLAGLGAVHDLGLIHRDVKPGNILLDRHSGRALVTDFGLVKRIQAQTQMTITGMVMGTADYIAPEQARGQEIDQRADLYAMGVMMYQMLAGRLPFHADTPTAMMFQHAYETPPPLEESSPELPDALVRIVMKLLEKNPEDRYQSAGDVLADLHNIEHPPKTAAVDYTQSDCLETHSPTGFLTRLKNRICDCFRSAKFFEELQTTQQQMNGAVAEYERRHKELTRLSAEAKAVLTDLIRQKEQADLAARLAGEKIDSTTTPESKEQALLDRQTNEKTAAELAQLIAEQQEQVETIDLELAKVAATLLRLRSQKNALNARLKAANMNLNESGRVQRTSLRTKVCCAAIMVCILGLGSYLSYTLWQKYSSKNVIVDLEPNIPVPSEWDILTRKLNDMANWEVKHGNWSLTSQGHFRGIGDSKLVFTPELPRDFILSFRMNVQEGMRPRIFVCQDETIEFGNEGFEKTLWAYGSGVLGSTQGTFVRYENKQDIAVTIHLEGERFKLFVNGDLTAVGTRDLTKPVALRLSGGDGWSPGTTDFGEFKIEDVSFSSTADFSGISAGSEWKDLIQLIDPAMLETASSSPKVNKETGLTLGQELWEKRAERVFPQYLDCQEYANLTGSQRETLEKHWLELISKGGDTDDYYRAINCLATIRSKKAVPLLLKIATARQTKDNRDRWMAVRALGFLGDKSTVPHLIPLLYHYNTDVRFWTQISLARLTGMNFENDWRRWGQWWNRQGEKPVFSFDTIIWTTRADLADYADPQKQQEKDRKTIERLIDQARSGEGSDVVGTWKLTGGTLVSDNPSDARLSFPYLPPLEYDYLIEFTAVDPFACVTQLVSRGTSPFAWTLNVGNPAVGFIEEFNEAASNPTKKILSLEPGKKHTTIIEIRKHGVRCFIDGMMVLAYPLNYGSLHRSSRWPLANPLKLGLSVRNGPVTFHRVAVREVSRNADIREAKDFGVGMYDGVKSDAPFTEWMTLAEMDRRLKANKDKGLWLTGVEGRWQNGEPQYRLREEPVPIRSYRWWWRFNKDAQSINNYLHEYAAQGFRLVYFQSFPLPDGTRRYQGIWQKVD